MVNARLFEMLYTLLNKGPMTADEMARRLEVSRRTVLRDVETLSQAGIPIYTSRGKHGGIRLMEGFVLSRSLLTERERQETLAALQGLGVLADTDGGEALGKLSALFGGAAADWLEADFSDWGSDQKNLFATVKSAILGQEVLSFAYCASTGESSERTVEPCKLLFRHRAWYLWAYCRAREGYRTFKLSRMTRLRATGERFSLRGDAAPSLPPPPQDGLVTLLLRIEAEQAHRVYDEFSPGEIEQNDDGSLLVRATYPEDEWVYGQILSFGPAAEVLEPPHVRELVAERIKKMAQRYQT